MHDFPAGIVTLPVQLSVSEKSLGSVPGNEILLTANAPFPVLFNVTVCGALAVPASCPGEKLKLAGESVAAACVAVPLSDTL